MANEGQIGVICEQGDMGLHYDPLNEKDQRRLQEQTDEANNKEKSKNR